MSNETEDLAHILRKIPVLTIFIAMEDETINLWVLGKKNNAIFRQGELKKGDAHADFFAVLLKDTLKKIGASRNIRCENRSLDGSRDKAASSGDDGKNSNPSRVKMDCHLREKLQLRKRCFALVHIAAHGKKKTCGISLAANPEWQSKTSFPMEEDYMLMRSDIQAIKLRARLVVLSCCHSGKGEVSSEGVVGMARAFLFAGVRSVLASLWAISDEATIRYLWNVSIDT